MLYKHFSAPWIWPPSVENRHGAGQGGHLITSSGPLLGLCGNAGAQYRGPASYSQPVALHLKPTLHICRWQCGGISLAVGGQNQPNRKTGSRGPRSRHRGGKPLEALLNFTLQSTSIAPSGRGAADLHGVASVWRPIGGLLILYL